LVLASFSCQDSKKQQQQQKECDYLIAIVCSLHTSASLSLGHGALLAFFFFGIFHLYSLYIVLCFYLQATFRCTLSSCRHKGRGSLGFWYSLWLDASCSLGFTTFCGCLILHRHVVIIFQLHVTSALVWLATTKAPLCDKQRVMIATLMSLVRNARLDTLPHTRQVVGLGTIVLCILLVCQGSIQGSRSLSLSLDSSFHPEDTPKKKERERER
jgi:hypothetical protein